MEMATIEEKKVLWTSILYLRAMLNFRKSTSTRASLKWLSWLEQIIGLRKSILKTATIEKQHTINFVCGDMENVDKEIDVYYHLV